MFARYRYTLNYLIQLLEVFCVRRLSKLADNLWAYSSKEEHEPTKLDVPAHKLEEVVVKVDGVARTSCHLPYLHLQLHWQILKAFESRRASHWSEVVLLGRYWTRHGCKLSAGS